MNAVTIVIIPCVLTLACRYFNKTKFPFLLLPGANFIFRKARTIPIAPAKEDPKLAAKPKDETPAQAAAIGKAVQSWAGAWSRKDVKAYLSHYGREFEPPKGLNRKAWEDERNQRLTKPGDIEVNLENVKVVSVNGDRATVKLRQHYRSANLSTSSNKTLNLMLQDGKWVIMQERVGG